MSAVLETIEVNSKEKYIIFEEDKNLPIVTMQIVFEQSGAIEDGNLSGLAKLSSKLLREGSKSDGSTLFAQKLESKAISLSASAGFETFVIEISSLKSEFNEGVKLLKKLLKEPNLTESTFEKVKTMAIGSLMQKESNYDYIASRELKSSLFRDTPLQSPISGTIESLKRIELKDIEEFIESHLTLNRAIVVVGGDLNISEAKSYSKDILSNLELGDEVSKIQSFSAKDTKEFKKVVKEDTKQAYIYFGAPLNIRVSDEDRFKAKVSSFILGSSGFGSRLMEEIRVKRGLAYSAYSRFTINKSHSYFSGYLQTKLESQDEAIEVVKSLIKDFIENGVTQKELESAKKFILGSEPLRNETLSQRLSRTFLEFYRDIGVGYHLQELEKIEALELDDLNQFIKSHSEILSLTISVVTNR